MTSLPGADLGPFAFLVQNLQEITEALAATTTQREVIEIVLTPAVQALGATAGIVLLVDHTDQQLKIAGSQGYEDGLPTLWQDGPIENNALIANILRMKEALYFEDVGALKQAYPELESRTGGLLPVASATLPMFLDHRPLGVIVLDFKEPHTFTIAERRFLTILSAQCAVALGRVEATVLLEDRVEERTRQLKERTRQLEDRTQQLEEQTRRMVEEQTAQAAFVAFTEAVGSETDLPTLVQQAITALQSRFPGVSVGYYEEEGSLWKARVWSDDMHTELVAVISAGLPSETPLIAQVIRTRQPVFTDAWDAQEEGVEPSAEYGAAAGYPLLVNSKLRSILSIGLRATRTWSQAGRALVQAVGRGLTLALERTEAARQLTLQNAELQAHTRALEAFAELTRDLALNTDPLLLIKRAQEVVMSMLLDGSAMYFVPEGDRWRNRVQYGTLRSSGLQAAVDAGLPYTEPSSLLIPWTTGQPYFQDVYDGDSDQLASVVGHVSATATLPLRIEGELTGVLAFALLNHRSWSSVDRVVLETTVQSLELALDRAAKTRKLDEERTALEMFTRFTRAVGSETDVQALVGHAITLLEETRSVDVIYAERYGDLFKIRHWNAGLPADLLARSQEGYSLDQPGLGRAERERQAIFEENWDAEQQGVPASAMYRAVAFQPFCRDGEMTSVLIIGSRTLTHWSKRDKGVFQAVGQSLDLALDRARQTRTVIAQRDALEGRTQELAARTRQLEDSTQELQAFSYSVSHDLRTPVRHMLGFLGLAKKSLDDRLDERSARHLNVVEQAGREMNTLIDALLDLSNAAQQTLRPVAIDLNEMMTQIQGKLTPDLTTRNVDWEVAPLPQVQGDWDALKQVLTQLTENALKFTRTRDPAVIRVWAEDQGEAWKVSVQDNGLGFDPRYRDRLFNLFQRLHSADEASGTGVGLASVRRLILKHGGQVFAEGQVGEGATFGFILLKGNVTRL
ncbi:GAF domain-containing protein [Deinococcus altitudinis]|uniref:GAF domain-containing protein n=1 Tax=Deinococcus altitudinis TaxID=468914 RepID=UPI0038919AF4